MREIKFRVWCKQSETMNTVSKMGFSEGELWYVEDQDSETQPPYFEGSNDWILMQYTGLKDKNGREIYEGDIVKYDLEVCELYVVQYATEAGQWYLHWLDKGRILNNVRFLKWSILGVIEVMGNIHEHPHLLQEDSKL